MTFIRITRWKYSLIFQVDIFVDTDKDRRLRTRAIYSRNCIAERKDMRVLYNGHFQFDDTHLNKSEKDKFLLIKLAVVFVNR